MEKYIITSDLIGFRETKETDLELVLDHEYKKENAPYVFQQTREEHINLIKSDDILHITVEDLKTEEIIAYMIIAGVSSYDDSIEFRRFVVFKKDKGYGKETMKVVKILAFEKLNAHRLWLDLRSENHKALHVYKSEGFVQEGILRDCVKVNGEYKSSIVMSMLKHEYDESN